MTDATPTQSFLTDLASFLSGEKNWGEMGNPAGYIQMLESATGKKLDDQIKVTAGEYPGISPEATFQTAIYALGAQYIGALQQDAAQAKQPTVQHSLQHAFNILSEAQVQGNKRGVVGPQGYSITYTPPKAGTGATPAPGATPTGTMPAGSTVTTAAGQVVDVTGMTAAQVQGMVSTGGVIAASVPGDPNLQASLNGILKKYTSGSSTGPSKVQIANAAAGFSQQLGSWGIDPSDPNMQALIQTASEKQWNSAHFLQELKDTAQFQQAFPGIFNPDGTLKYSPSQYVQMKKQYSDIASQAGINLNQNTTDWLFRNNVTPATFQARASADAQLRQNAPLFQAFSDEVVRTGLSKTPPTHEELLKFVMGQGNNEWRNLWDNAASRYGAEQAGLQFGKAADRYQKISQSEVAAVADKGLTPEEAAKGFHDVATQMLQTLPFSRIQKAGLTHKDFVTATFGGKGSVEAQAKIMKVAQQERVFEQSPGAIASTGQTQTGRTLQQGSTANADVATI